MADMPLIVAFTLGALVHTFYFRIGEHHLYPARYIYLYGGLPVAIALFLEFVHEAQLVLACTRALSLVSIHLAGLYCSLFIYRVLLHPLCRFPGPLGARVSFIWLFVKLHRKPLFHILDKLHSQYGDFVRMGPSALSITHPKAVNLIYGFGSPCTKNDFYDMAWPVQSLHSYRTKAAHDQRRRIWSRGFSDKALRGYEKRIRVYRQKLVNYILSMDGQPINVSNWFNWYSYDVMGDLAFGQSFEMLDSSTNHWVIQLLMDGVKQFKYLMPIWLFRLLPSIPGLTQEWWRFTDFCNRRLVTRMQSKLEIPDISASLLDPLQGQVPTTEEFYQLLGDTQLIITAGSDTTATTLTTILYELAKRPEEAKKIRAELAPYTADLNKEYSHEKIANLQHLNGFMNETLRLHPPIPSAIQRKTPPEGIDIDGIYIPGNMTVYCPQWVIGRSEDVYHNAKEFFPERWYKYPEMIKEKSAYAPFTIGPYMCIGKPLALMNVRTTIARLIMTFDIQLPPNDDGHLLERNISEHFSTCVEDIQIVFYKRDL